MSLGSSFSDWVTAFWYRVHMPNGTFGEGSSPWIAAALQHQPLPPTFRLVEPNPIDCRWRTERKEIGRERLVETSTFEREIYSADLRQERVSQSDRLRTEPAALNPLLAWSFDLLISGALWWGISRAVSSVAWVLL
jgi:hypothetical protein